MLVVDAFSQVGLENGHVDLVVDRRQSAGHDDIRTDPGARERLEHKRRELLLIWHPHRYANLTNNPKKYMKMYKQGEAMTKEIQAAYELLIARLEKKN